MAMQPTVPLLRAGPLARPEVQRMNQMAKETWNTAWMARCPAPTGTQRGQTTREGLRSPETGWGGGGHAWGNLAGRGGREGPGSGHVLAGEGRPKRGKTWALAPGSSSGP